MRGEDTHTLPDFSDEYKLRDDQIKQYEKQGHIYLKNVASVSEVSSYEPYIVDLANRLNTDTRPLSERYFYGNALQQTMNTWRRSEMICKFVFGRRFAKIAADLMQVDQVRLNHDCVLFKEPGVGPTPWHQDQKLWPMDTDKTISMWMPLTDITEEMGTLNYFSGSHKWGDISDNPQKTIIDAIRKGCDEVNYGDMKAGDALFHAGWVLHNANGNQTAALRKVMTIIYYADGARVVDPAGDSSKQMHLNRFFPGLAPGDLIKTAMNPVLYSRNEYTLNKEIGKNVKRWE